MTEISFDSHSFGVVGLEALNLAGTIASIMSLPLVVIPVLSFLALRKWGPEVKGWQKIALYGVFAFGICAYVLDVIDRIGWLDQWLAKLPLKEVTDQVFINQRVPISGYSYNHCKFINVTFLIENKHGMAGEIKNSEVGPYTISSDDWTIRSVFTTLNALGALKGPAIMDGKISPPFGPGTTFPQNPVPLERAR
jgi:hypothetical protein